MSDLEQYKNMLDKAGVIYRESAGFEKTTRVVVEALVGPHNEGYQEFFCVHTFDSNGNLILVGCWE